MGYREIIREQVRKFNPTWPEADVAQLTINIVDALYAAPIPEAEFVKVLLTPDGLGKDVKRKALQALLINKT